MNTQELIERVAAGESPDAVVAESMLATHWAGKTMDAIDVALQELPRLIGEVLEAAQSAMNSSTRNNMTRALTKWSKNLNDKNGDLQKALSDLRSIASQSKFHHGLD